MAEKILFCTSVFQEDINSSGRHMIDLVKEFDKRGYYCEVITNIGKKKSDLPNTRVRSLGVRVQGLSNLLRFMYEIVTPFILYLKYRKTFKTIDIQAVVVYSPSIFWYIFVNLLGKRIKGQKLLIVRDIFPLWLADVGLVKKTSLTYRILNYFCQ